MSQWHRDNPDGDFDDFVGRVDMQRKARKENSVLSGRERSDSKASGAREPLHADVLPRTRPESIDVDQIEREKAAAQPLERENARDQGDTPG